MRAHICTHTYICIQIAGLNQVKWALLNFGPSISFNYLALSIQQYQSLALVQHNLVALPF